MKFAGLSSLQTTPCERVNLLNLLDMVPDMLQVHVLPLWPTPGAGIRVLRSVCKTMGMFALQAITSCKLELGQGSKPASHKKVARLLSHARLQQLSLTVITYPGIGNQSLAKQLSTCTSQWKTLFTGMAAAISCVKHAELNVTRRSGSVRYQDLDELDNAFSANSADDVSHLPAEIFAKLAAAMPLLQHLTMQGYCVDVAFSEFGEHCPQLKSLKVEALNTDLDALGHIELILPNLSHFTVSNKGPVNKQHCICYLDFIRKYVDNCCKVIHKCKHIKILQLDLWAKHEMLGSEVTIECSKYVWDSLPASLDEVRCDVEMRDFEKCSVFMSKVRVLHLSDGVPYDLFDLMKAAPCLEEFKHDSGQSIELIWDNGDMSPADMSGLKTRLLDGFKLSCDWVCISGNSTALKEVMTCFSPLLATTRCDVSFDDTVQDLDLLDQLVRVVPNVVHLSFADAWRDNQGHDVDDRVSKAFVSLKSLKVLDMRLPLVFPEASGV